MFAALGFLVPCLLQAQTDSLLLEESILVGRKNETVLQASGNGVKIKAERLRTLPMLLGSADPMRLARYLPSMQASSELDYGLHIQGNDHSHNLVSSGGVPIYGAAHLLGIFSVFNPSHYDTFNYSIQAPEYNRLGGMLDMELPQSMPERVCGDVSAGLLAFQGNVRIPMGKSSLGLSLRRSYLNLLYGAFMKIGDRPLKYGFTDANITWQWQPGARDKVWIDAYYGSDRASCFAPSGAYGTDISWENAMGALHWRHGMNGNGTLEQTAYATGTRLNPHIYYTGMETYVPSFIVTAGYRAVWSKDAWRVGADFAAHRALPQDVRITGTFTTNYTPQSEQHGQEMSVFASYARTFGPFGVHLGMKGLLWHSPDGRWMPDVGPDISLSWNFYSAGKLTASAGLKHQYLMQAGITDLGLPCEFWFLAGDVNDPQHSLGTSLSYTLPFAEDMFFFQAEVYYKTLRNQVEYKNGFCDLLYAPYSLEDVIMKGDGRAYGADFMIQKKAGKFTGWLSYAFGRSLRTYEGIEGEIPSAHERIHELDLVASYHTGKWDFGLTFMLATGSPYTPPVALYLLSNQIVVQYGPHNSGRLGTYRRLDLSASYCFSKTDRLEHGINLSVYNALGAKNELLHSLVVDSDCFYYDAADINIRFMPSICYYLKF